MAAFKLVNIVALATLAVLAGSYGPQPVNALSAHGSTHLNRADHHAIAQKQRRQDAKKSRRCRKRPSSLTSSAAASTSSAQVTSSDVKTSSSEIKTSSIKATSTAVKTSSEVKSSETPKDSPAPQTTPKATSTKTSSSAQHTSTPASNNNGGSNNGGDNNNGGSNNNGDGGANPGGKIGLAWPNGNSPKGWTGKDVGWMYSWSPFPPTDYDKFPGLKFIPMLWGPDQEGDFTKNAAKYANGGWVASFNEPNQAGQSNIDPTYAASIHKRVIQPLADKGMKVLAPATSSDPRGMDWMKTFMKACDGCKFHAMGIHYYDISFEGFKTYMNLWHDTFGLPLMVTEFACQDFNGGPQRNMDEVWAFWSQSIKYMESQDWIMAYFGFGAMRQMQGVNPDNQLMNPGNGQPNALGSTYINKSW